MNPNSGDGGHFNKYPDISCTDTGGDLTLLLGFAFLKRNTQFLKGRSIISYGNSMLCRLLLATSQATTLMLQTVWWDGFGCDVKPWLWQRIHDFFKQTHHFVLLVEADLTGFFNAVPRCQILSALECLQRDYSEAGCPDCFSVTLSPRPGQGKAFPGKPRGGQTAACKCLYHRDIIDIAQLSFTALLIGCVGNSGGT